MSTQSMRRGTAITAAALVLATGCAQRGLEGCFGLLDPCDPPDVRSKAFRYITGIPLDRVDLSTTLASGGYRATLHVGDTLSLQLLENLAADTVSNYSVVLTTTTWSVSDSSVARIADRPADGSGLLSAVGPGEVLPIRATDREYPNGPDNQLFYVAWACASEGKYGCHKVTEVIVVP